MEMEAVADIFDQDRDGFINYKEFIAALRPDRGSSEVSEHAHWTDTNSIEIDCFVNLKPAVKICVSTIDVIYFYHNETIYRTVCD